MSEELNIFQNLEDLEKTNLLEQLKSTAAIELNDYQSEENDDFDFDSLMNNSIAKKTVPKRQKTEKKISITNKKGRKSRQSSTSTESSISPTLPLLDNLRSEVDKALIGRGNGRCLRPRKKVEMVVISKNNEHLPPNKRSSGKRGKRGRGGGRSRERGRIRAPELPESSLCVSSDTSSVEAANEPLDIERSTLNIMERFVERGRRGRLRVMCRRRECVAEIAARNAPVDYIDLVSSPMPRVEGVIELDSCTEEPKRVTRSKTISRGFPNSSEKCKISTVNSNISPFDISLEEDNPEMNIKVKWKGKLETFKLRKHQKFSVIFEQLAERENINIDSIVFNLNERIIVAEDTPDSINYKIFHFIDGRVLSSRFISTIAAPIKKRDANEILLKVQSDKWKRPMHLNIMKTDKFRILYIKCAEELKVGVDQLTLSFDGELIDSKNTPVELDFEGGEAIDLRIK